MRIYLASAITEADRDDDGNPLWWSNESGWSSIDNALVFSVEEANGLNPPYGGEFVAFGDNELPKTDDEFMRKMLDAFPEATVGQDNDGQLVIYTNLRLTGYRIESMGDWIRRWHQG